MIYSLILAMLLLVANGFSTPIILVGIAGGSGSGKTTLAKNVQNVLQTHSVLISQDNYYKDLSHLPEKERDEVNFDHPGALDLPLLKQHLLDLKSGKSIEKPIYDFKSHTRKTRGILVQSAPLVILEGILIFAAAEIRELLDLKIFMDADEDVRLLRRIERDMKERNRDFMSIKDQYLTTVKPMYESFVKPSKKYADVIVPRGGENAVALNFITSKLKQELSGLEDLLLSTSKNCQ